TGVSSPCFSTCGGRPGEKIRSLTPSPASSIFRIIAAAMFEAPSGAAVPNSWSSSMLDIAAGVVVAVLMGGSILVGAVPGRASLAPRRRDIHLADRIRPPPPSVVLYARESTPIAFAAPLWVTLLQPPARMDQQFFHVVLKDVERVLFLKRNGR